MMKRGTFFDIQLPRSDKIELRHKILNFCHFNSFSISVFLIKLLYILSQLFSTTIYLWLISLTASKELSILLLKLYNGGAIGISASFLGLRVRKID